MSRDKIQKFFLFKIILKKEPYQAEISELGDFPAERPFKRHLLHAGHSDRANLQVMNHFQKSQKINGMISTLKNKKIK